jgi:hypothetical protein
MFRFSHHRLFLLITLVFVSVLALAACSTTPTTTGPSLDNTPTATPSLHVKLGQAVKVEDTWQITLNNAMTSSKVKDAKGKSVKPSIQGDVFLVLTVSLQNITSDPQDAAPSQQFSLKDSSGHQYRYDPAINSSAVKNLAGAIDPATTANGTLVYQVPKSVHTFTLTYQTDVTSQQQITWDVSV